MSIVITGATGHLGSLTIDALLQRGVAADDIVAAGRDAERLRPYTTRGVSTAQIDFDDVDSLTAAFDGAERVLLVSGTDVGSRVPQHRNVIDAATKTGVSLLAYTSAPRADATRLLLAADHRGTEEALRESDLPHVLLRNSWYYENYTGQFASYRQQGRIVGAAGDGLISGAARADYAEAAAAVLSSPGHEGAVYELGGDEPFTMSDLADELSRQTGETIPYENVSVEEYEAILVGVGLPAELAAIYADIDRGVAAGELLVETGDLRRLVGRPLVPLSDAVAAAL